jgi:hypothetical protein
MNFKSIINDVCCDKRIKNGVLDIKNAEHVFVLQEYLEASGLDINEIVDKTVSLFEAGRFPERQAYNKDGILVTFPNKEYRDRAVNKGTHFAENPKKSDTNIFGQADAAQATDAEKSSDEEPKDVSIDKELIDKVVDSDVDKRTDTEKAEDSQVVQSILTGQSPLVNYSVDEAKNFGFYKKGYQWYDVEGNLIGEQVYDEVKGKYISSNEAISPTKYLKKVEKIKDLINIELLTKLDFLKNAEKTQRTLIFETIPILFANGIDTFTNLNAGGDYHPYAISFLKEWGNLRAKLESISNEKEREENLKIYDLVDKDLKEIGGLNGVSLESLGKPTDFIHKDIKKFYTYAGEYNKRFVKKSEGKENTADIVLIYGGTANDVYEALKSGNIEQQDVDSMAKIANKDTKFALISLKAGSAKLGRVLTQLVSYVGQNIPAVPSKEKNLTPLNEGLIDTISNSISSLITKLKGVPDLAKQYYKDFITVINPFSTKISNFFTKELNTNIKQIDASEYKNIQRLEQDIEKEIGSISEAKGKCGEVGAELSNSLFKNIKLFKNILKSDNTDVILIQKILQFSNNPLLKQIFPIFLDEKQIEEVKNFRGILINLLNEIEQDFDVNDCIDRETLNPVLKYRGNILSLRYIDLILSNILKDVNTSDPDKIREEFIKLASILSTEAVFGNNVSLPLIKYTGKKIEKLKYKNNFKFEVPNEIDDLKLGKLKINIVPEQGYLTVYLYLFNGMVTKDDITVPTYIEYLMNSVSGSSFTFSVEGAKVVEKI